MAYADYDDIVSKISTKTLNFLLDYDGDGTVEVGELVYVDDAIARADALIDQKLGRRYTVPFTTVPEFIRVCSETIATYFLWRRRTGLARIDPDAQNDFTDAMRRLDEIADDEEDLPGVSSSDPGPQSNSSARTPEATRTHYDADGNALDDTGSMEDWP